MGVKNIPHDPNSRIINEYNGICLNYFLETDIIRHTKKSA